VNFADRLHAAIESKGNPALIGIDPHLDLLPDEFAAARDRALDRPTRARAMGDFCVQLVELAAARVPAIKPQSAFFEAFGADGAREYERVIERAHELGLVVIGDVKRGDIASTAAAYARGLLEDDGGNPAALADAVTVNAFLGEESITPFLEVCARAKKGLYVLVRTSNPGSADFQLCGEPTLSERIADAVHRWGHSEAALVGACGMSSIGAVVGATHPKALAALRTRMPSTPLLLPGYGAQGAGANDVAPGFFADGQGALVNSSRGVAFAYKKAGRPASEWRDAASLAIDTMIDDLSAVARA
jgi:orotidine-5'-phosphate decarboxylase